MSLFKPPTDNLRSRLVVVSNRGAYTMENTKDGNIIKPSVSGMVSAIDPIVNNEGGLWVAWGGRYSPNKTLGLNLPLSDKCSFQEIMLTPQEVENYYSGFSNSCLWPLCHSFLEKTVFNERHWQVYKKVNEKYARALLEITDEKDLIWIQDFHLALLPKFMRNFRPTVRQSLFWHIPFPPVEIFSALPWGNEIIKGLLECDMLAFHTESYVRNFLQCAEKIGGARVDYTTGRVHYLGRELKTAAIPIGIEWRSFTTAAKNPDLINKAAEIRKGVGGQHIILGVDRLDYTKGIPEKLRAIEYLLENYPEYRGKLTYIQIAVPTRAEVAAYQNLRSQVEEMVGKINGRFTEGYHLPVRYLYKSLTKNELISYYMAADMALVTPLKDGLNLVAKEYVAVKNGGNGILLLSPFAGVASQFKEALTANPYSPKSMALQILSGLKMSEKEKISQMSALAKTVREKDIHWWWRMIRYHWLASEKTDKKVPLTVIAGSPTGAISGKI